MGTIYKRGRIWWIAYYRNNQQLCESTHSTDVVEARRQLRIREGKISEGIPITRRTGQVRIAEILDSVLTDYRLNGRRSTQDAEIRVRLHLAPAIGGRRASDFTTADVQAYALSRQKASAANGQINRELALLKRGFRLAVQSGLLAWRPHIPMLRESNVRKGFFERDQFDSVLRHIPEHLHGFLITAYITGWRVSEIRGLRWSNVDLQARELRLDPGESKNEEGRVFPMTKELAQVLEDWKRRQLDEQHAYDRIVPWVFWYRYRGKVRPIGDFGKRWDRACNLAGVPGRIPHDCRRTAVRNLIRAGVPEVVAMQMTGHRTRAVFDRYNIVSSRDLQSARDALERSADNYNFNYSVGFCPPQSTEKNNLCDLASELRIRRPEVRILSGVLVGC